MFRHAREYSRSLERVVRDTAAAVPPWAHPLVAPRQVRVPAYLVVTSDRGLAGGYNAEVVRKAEELLGWPQRGVVAVVGKKGRDALRRRGYRLAQEHLSMPEIPDEGASARIARALLSEYLKGAIDALHLVYAEFVSRASYRPTARQLLPIEPGARVDDASRGISGLYEPSPEGVLERLFPFHLGSAVYAALLEARASELAARARAMDAAVDNAEELADRLTLEYNRARQAEVTQEVSEIVTAAESLR